jgi:MFS family permease
MWKNLSRILRHPQYRNIAMMFAVNSLLFTFWITRIPQIKTSLELSESELGLLLFFGPVGGLAAMLVANWLTARLGEGRLTLYSMFGAVLAAYLPVAAPSTYWLALGLFAVGFLTGVMNVAMNAVVSLLERRDGVHMMITCHGGWSLGGLVGSFSTSLIVGAQIPAWHHWLLLTLGLSTWALLSAWPSLQAIRLGGPAGPALVLPTRPVLGLALIGMLVMIGEGAAADWSGVYLAEVVGASDYFVGMGYASFTLFMTLGRFYGDTLTARLGGLRVVRIGTALAVGGLLLVLWPALPSTLVGFGLMGLGYSCVVPVLFSRSGQVPGLSPSMGIAAVASAGYVGFLSGPVLIGLLAEHLGLQLGFGLLLLLTALAFGLSPRAMAWAR